MASDASTPQKAGSSAPRTAPEVWLNHVLRTVPPGTYQAIRESSFLRNVFAGSEERETSADSGDTWTGLYFYGEHSYFEFFMPEPGEPSEGSGIAFSVERTGELRQLGAILASATSRDVAIQSKRRVRGSERVPWASFLFIGSDDPDSVFGPWVMEIDPDYHRLWYSEESPQTDGVSRWHQNAKRYDADRLLKDLVGVTAALTRDEADCLVRDLRVCGYGFSQSEGALVGSGPGCSIRIIEPGQAVHGVTQADFELNRAMDAGEARRIGDTTLLFLGGLSAAWTFGPEVQAA